MIFRGCLFLNHDLINEPEAAAIGEDRSSFQTGNRVIANCPVKLCGSCSSALIPEASALTGIPRLLGESHRRPGEIPSQFPAVYFIHSRRAESAHSAATYETRERPISSVLLDASVRAMQHVCNDSHCASAKFAGITWEHSVAFAEPQTFIVLFVTAPTALPETPVRIWLSILDIDK